MKNNVMGSFSPELRIFGDGEQLVVTFDSLAAFDAKRAARSIRIPAAFKQLSFMLEGFDKDSVTDVADRRTVVGKISLSIVDGNEQTASHVLADCQFIIPASGKAKNGVFPFVPVEQIEYAVRQGVSDALVAATNHYYATRAARAGEDSDLRRDAFGMMPPSLGAVAASATGPGGSLRARTAANDGVRTSRRKIAFVVGAPLLLLFLVFGVSKVFAPASPIDEAVARAMASDPSSVASQVEMTKEVLKQMGLDPGQGGDIGCLAPQ